MTKHENLHKMTLNMQYTYVTVTQKKKAMPHLISLHPFFITVLATANT